MMDEEISTRNHGERWAISELRFLEQQFGRMTNAEIGRHLGRTATAVRAMAKRTGCRNHWTRLWTEAEKEILRSNYTTGIKKKLIYAMLPKRTLQSIYLMAYEMGLSRDPYWQQKEIDILKKHYPTEGPDVANRLSARSREAVKLKASNMGIRYLGEGKPRLWSDDELALLRENHHIALDALCSLFPRRSKIAVIRARWKCRKEMSDEVTSRNGQ